MNKQQENKLTMYEAVSAVLEKHASTVSSFASLATAKTDMTELLQKVKAKGRNKKEATAGKTKNKEQAREVLIEALLRVASPLYSFGRRTKNTEAAAIADVKESALQRLRDTDLAARATSIHGQASEHLGSLGNFGITVETLADLQAKIGGFSAALADREAGVAERIGATAALSDLFKEMDNLLRDELDRLVLLTRGSSDAFHREYFAARVVKDLGARREQPKNQPTTPQVTKPSAVTVPSSLIVPLSESSLRPPPAPQPGVGA
jgi:hypothetical protein